MVLGAAFFLTPEFGAKFNSLGAVLLPLVLASVGIVASIIGTFFVKVKEGGDPQKALNLGNIVAGTLMIIASWFLIKWLLPETWYFQDPLYQWADPVKGNLYTSSGIFIATVVGIISGALIGMITEYYTGSGKGPVIGLSLIHI